MHVFFLGLRNIKLVRTINCRCTMLESRSALEFRISYRSRCCCDGTAGFIVVHWQVLINERSQQLWRNCIEHCARHGAFEALDPGVEAKRFVIE